MECSVARATCVEGVFPAVQSAQWSVIAEIVAKTEMQQYMEKCAKPCRLFVILMKSMHLADSGAAVVMPVVRFMSIESSSTECDAFNFLFSSRIGLPEQNR